MVNEMRIEDWLAVVACAVIVAGSVSWLVRPGWLTMKAKLAWLDVLIVRSRVRNRWLRWRLRRVADRYERKFGVEYPGVREVLGRMDRNE